MGGDLGTGFLCLSPTVPMVTPEWPPPGGSVDSFLFKSCHWWSDTRPLGWQGGWVGRCHTASTASPVGPPPPPSRCGIHHSPRDGPQPGHGPRRERPRLLLPGAAGGRWLRHGGQHRVGRPPSLAWACRAGTLQCAPPLLTELPRRSSQFPRMFSHCSRADLEVFVEKPHTACLVNAPDPDRLLGGPVCGNLFVERGEQCDCGPPQV